MLLRKRHSVEAPAGLDKLGDALIRIDAEWQRRRDSDACTTVTGAGDTVVGGRWCGDSESADNQDVNLDAPLGAISAPITTGISTTVSGCELKTLSDDELTDLGRLVEIAEYVLVKYYEKKNFHSILEPFVEMIRESAESLNLLEDDVEELLLAAESSIGRIREVHNGMCQD